MTDQVAALIAEAERLPYGEARTVLVERALREAEALREPEPTIAARLALTQAYQYGGEPAKSFATFSRTVAAYDAEPGRFTEWQAHRVLWQYKWIMSDMRNFPEIPLRRALDALDDMERRYRAAGTPHAVYAHRCRIAVHLGDEPGVKEWFHRWETTPRDGLSDCHACDLSGKAHVLSWLGRDAEAVAVAAPVVAGEFSCGVQPQGILCTLLLPYVRTGRLDAAADAHRRAYRLVQGQIGYLDDIGDHLEFCALTGHETRGLEILERELPWLDRPPSPTHARRFMTGAALVLRRLMETGHDGLAVRRAGRDVPVPELHAELAAGAREIAARFDARNGNDVHTRRVEAALAAEPLVAHLPLLPHARHPTTGSPDEHWHRGTTALDTPEPESVGMVASDAEPESGQVVGSGAGREPGEVADSTADSVGGEGRIGGAVRDLVEAVAGFAARGDAVRAALARVDLCRAYLEARRPLDAAETAEEALAMLDPADTANLMAVRRTRARALIQLREHDAGLAALREIGDAAA
ncbi:MAG TPA: hypothetical protein VM347_27905, partial [Nonomuraea sp.]|nr:hypothetical protein [Nonomuraea sp.]